MPPPGRPPHRSPDRRLMPRPLPAHLASAMLLWLSSRGGLTSLPGALPRSKPPGDMTESAPGKAASDPLRAIAAEIQARGPERIAAALDRELGRRAAAFLTGLEAYRRHPFERPKSRVPVRWRQGAARLLDYGRTGRAGPAVLIVPSLIN